MAFDVLVAILACLGAIGLRFGFDFAGIERLYGDVELRVTTFAFWVVIGMLNMGMYRIRQRPTTAEMMARVLMAVAIGTICNVLFSFFFPSLFVAGRGVMILATLLTASGLICSRFLLKRVIEQSPVKRRVLVLGSGEYAEKIRNMRRLADRRRFDVVGFVPVSEQERELAASLRIEPLVELSEVSSAAIDEIVVALEDRRGSLPVDFLLAHKQKGVRITELIEFLERETEHLHLDILRPGWLLYERSSETDLMYHWLKRGFDILFGVLLLVVALPLLLLAALAIKVEGGWSSPIFYRQRRVGLHGHVIRLFKFRSMRVDAERGTGPRWSSSGDDRVTRTGRLLRRFRIDELPQMINIIRGDMSVVGPRPERPEFVEMLARNVPLYYYRHSVRPGLTGWAQLNYPYGASVDDAREKLKYDLYYIKNASLILDTLILLQTAEVVVWGRATTMAAGARPGDPVDRKNSDDTEAVLVKRPPKSDLT